MGLLSGGGGLDRALLDALGALNPGNEAGHDGLGLDGDEAVSATRGLDEDVEGAGHDETGHSQEEGDVGKGEAGNVDGVHAAAGVEVGVGEGGDDGEDGRGDVAQDRAPEHGNVPVLAVADDDVEVTSHLVGLWRLAVAFFGMSGGRSILTE